MRNMGIYKITNLVNQKVYIGSSINLENRMKNHISRLRTNNHKSKHLQNAFNKYGESNFEFSILEKLDDEKFLLTREDYYIDLYMSCERSNGYNTYSATRRIGFKHTEETRLKISNIQKGKKISEETRMKISKSNMGKEKLSHEAKKTIGIKNRRKHMSNKVEEEIRRLLIENNDTSLNISKIYGFSKEVTMRIKRELEKEGLILSNKERNKLIKEDLIRGKKVEDIAKQYNISIRTVQTRKGELKNESKTLYGCN